MAKGKRSRRSMFVYAVLAVCWFLVVAGQASEHLRTREIAKQTLRNRARDIATSLSVVVRSQSRFGVLSRGRIEDALRDLTESSELRAVALLNSAGETTASAGTLPIAFAPDFLKGHEHWTGADVTFVDLVALGPATDDEERPPAVVPSLGVIVGRPPAETLAPPSPHPLKDILLNEDTRNELLAILSGKPLTADQVELLLSLMPAEVRERGRDERLRAILTGAPLDRERLDAIERVLQEAMVTSREFSGRPRRHEDGPPHFKRPPWLGESEYQELLAKQGIHWFVLTMSAHSYRAETARDLNLRLIVVAVALLALAMLGFAWHLLERSTDLRVSLARAGEMNIHLREMNVAAAGLAHETKNPLNLVRGSAQIIARHRDVPDLVRHAALAITDEVDRVTERLNRFMDYSKPPEISPAPVDLAETVRDVYRVLDTDREDKAVTVMVDGPKLRVEADPALLRQVVFNLVLNALQAVSQGGRIVVRLARDGHDSAAFEVFDNGPGVAPEFRDEVFRPYVTMSEKGTGLGLAVVRQVVLAHHWDITLTESELGGACFRVTGLRVV